MDDGRQRLDIYVSQETGYARSFSAELIRRGLVAAGGKVILKPGEKVQTDCVLRITAPENIYVGRGGYKLEHALDNFHIELDGKVCADIGASTGGFTDCMLRRGAAKVYAVENGRGQLADLLLSDPRVVSLEDTNVTDLEDVLGGALTAAIDFVAVDVSFVSVVKIIDAVAALIKPDCEAVLLCKPQFEAGPGAVGKSGVIRDPRIHGKVINNVSRAVENAGLRVLGIIESPVRGKGGNTEFLMHLHKFILEDRFEKH